MKRVRLKEHSVDRSRVPANCEKSKCSFIFTNIFTRSETPGLKLGLGKFERRFENVWDSVQEQQLSSGHYRNVSMLEAMSHHLCGTSV